MANARVVSKRTIRVLVIATSILCCAVASAQAQLLESISDAVDTVKTKVTDIQAKVNAIKSDVTESADQLAAGLLTLSADVRKEIAESLGEVNEGIENLKAERLAFSTNGAVFKNDLIGMLANLESLSGEVSRYTGLPVTYEFSTERTLVGALPDRALGPMYAALAGESGAAFTSFVGRLGDATQFLHQLNTLTECPAMLKDSDTVLTAVSTVRKIGGATKLVGKGLVAAGATGVSGKPVQIWGFVGVEIQNDRKKKWGERLSAVGDLLLQIASSADNKLRYCTIINGSEQILARLANLNLDLTNLDVPVSTRASQSSVDALGHDVQLTLASVGQLGDDQNLLLRLKVEEGLAGNTKGVALLTRPLARHGLLDMVREVAQDTILDQQTLRGPLEKAWDLLWAGDGAAAIGDFSQAYDLYGKAYRAAVR